MAEKFTVEVAVPVPLRQTFDYLPDPASPDVDCYTPGTRCLVPFGSRQLTGIILRINAPVEETRKLKPITRLLDPTPVLTPSLLSLGQWIGSYYLAAVGEQLISMLPPSLRRKDPLSKCLNQIAVNYWTLTDAPSKQQEPPKGKKQREALALLEAQSPRSVDCFSQAGISTATLRSLEQRGDIYCQKHLPPLPQADQEEGTSEKRSKVLTDQQADVLGSLAKAGSKFHVSLLQGVTGSGKTEVYLQWLQRIILEGNPTQALVLVPEIALTPQTITRFTSRFPGIVDCYHSELNDSQRLLAWERVRQGHTRILIGTRSALFQPFQHLAAIIVDEEHDSSFKQQDGARYHARDMAIVLAKHWNTPIMLGSATPSFETLINAQNQRYQWLHLTERASGIRKPLVRLIDTRSRPLDGGICPPVMAAIQHALEEREQVLVFINRRGYAPTLMCTDCGWTADCRNCDARLIYHMHLGVMRCHHCDSQMPPPLACPSCQSPSLKPIGAGTERTEEVLQTRFTDIPVIRIDRDSTSRRGSLQTKLAQIRKGAPCIIVGTQMLAKGHDFPNLRTVVILNADGGLFSSDFRSAERTAQLLLQVSGRAGRQSIRGQVLMQTQFAEHPLLQAISQQDYMAVYRGEIAARKSNDLPPFRKMVTLRGEADNQMDCLEGLSRLSELLNSRIASAPYNLDSPDDASTLITLHGPFPSLISRRHNRHHGLLWLLSSRPRALQQLLSTTLFPRLPKEVRLPTGFRWQVDVDPLETL